MKRVALILCIVFIGLPCFGACGQSKIVNIGGKNVFEFTADRDYFDCSFSFYLLYDKESEIQVREAAVLYQFASSWHTTDKTVYKGDRVRIYLYADYGNEKDVAITADKLYKIKLYSKEDPSIFYEQIFNQ